jgi:hypothetical protein
MDATLTDGPAAPVPDAAPAPLLSHETGRAVRTEDGGVRTHRVVIDPGPAAPGVDTEGPLAPELLADLDDPRLVLSEGYVGTDRRGTGFVARLLRATFTQRRSLLRLEIMVAVALAAVGMALATSVLFAGADGRSSGRGGRSDHAAESPTRSDTATDKAPVVKAPAVAAQPVAATAPSTTAPTPTPTTAPVPVAAPAAPAAAPAAPAAAPAATPAAALSPTQLGAQALALVRYPWQRITGYSIQFLPISDAPSPGFYGNTTFTWGQTGGTSVLYVYPGETVQRLAGITAFEIGHEVDAAAVEPQGGEAQIENILGMHPASWAPDCDCAEQGFLSGWYAAAFSNYWSPGVGDWSALAPEPAGAVLAAVEPWLNPSIS